MSNQKQKFVYIFTAAADRAEDAIIGFTLANVAMSMEDDATIVLLGDASLLAKKGYAETVHAPERLPLNQLMDTFLSDGGKIIYCGPCIKARNLSKDDMVESVIDGSAISVQEEISQADKIICF